jgi:hypothetical protein
MWVYYFIIKECNLIACIYWKKLNTYLFLF